MTTPFIFLSYAHEDKPQVDDVYRQLKGAGLTPWMDHPPDPYAMDGIPPGVDWDVHIRQKLRDASLVLVFLSSRSVEKTGYIQREYRIALGLLAEKPTGQQWLIPVRFDDCKPPAHRVDGVSLDQLNWYDLTSDDKLPRLVAYLKAALPTSDQLTGEHFALIYSSWRASKHDARFNQKVYRFDVVLDGPIGLLDRVETVTYLLPPAWPTSPVTVSDRSKAFGLKELAWADLLVRAKIHVRDQTAPIPMSTFVRLTEHGPRLV
jgi:hypothetical protein